MKKETPLDKEERAYWIIIIVIGIIALLIAFFAWVGITPSSFIPSVFIIEGVGVVIVVIFAILLILRSKNHIKQSFAKKYYKKLERKINEELETEVKNKKLMFFQDKPKVMRAYTEELTDRISKDLSPITREVTKGGTYDREKTIQAVFIASSGFKSLPFDEAIVFAKKMDELDKNKRYRRKILFYLFS
jgi:c-di-AMP phosphodiesterase-like protein